MDNDLLPIYRKNTGNQVAHKSYRKWQSWNFNSDPDSPIVCAVLFLIEKFVREHLVLKGGKRARVMEV